MHEDIDDLADSTRHAAVRVCRLLMSPIKGLGMHSTASVDVTSSGVLGDRQFFLMDHDDALLSITRTGTLTDLIAHLEPASRLLSVRDDSGDRVSTVVEHGEAVSADFYGHHRVTGRVVAGPWAEFFSGRVGQSVRLVEAELPNGGCDIHPVTLLCDASTAAVGARAGVAIDPRRFRMTLGLTGTEAFAEDEWHGCLMHVGGAVLRVGGPVKRCAATTRHPDSGQRDVPMLRMLKASRGLQSSELGVGVNLGVYASVLEPGRVGVGDVVQLEPSDAGRVVVI